MKTLFLIIPLLLAGCASDQPPGPEGTGEHKVGYLLGRSDAVKQHYWMTQNLQKKQPEPQPPHFSTLPITIPGATTNGITTVPHTENLLIENEN